MVAVAGYSYVIRAKPPALRPTLRVLGLQQKVCLIPGEAGAKLIAARYHSPLLVMAADQKNRLDHVFAGSNEILLGQGMPVFPLHLPAKPPKTPFRVQLV